MRKIPRFRDFDPHRIMGRIDGLSNYLMTMSQRLSYALRSGFHAKKSFRVYREPHTRWWQWFQRQFERELKNDFERNS